MSKRNCLYCYQKLDGGEIDFHSKCSKKIFGKPLPPLLVYTNDQMLELAEKIIQSQSTVPGVQAKLSLGLQTMDEKDKPQKLTIMGFWGEYILKPPSEHYKSLPELEDLTMHLAAIAGIRTVPHSLIRLKSGELSYITKRIDRKGKQKFHMEDMCQLTDRLTESKYRGSYEQIGKALVQFSSNPGFDIIGNNDMHLKNFSLFKDPEKGYNLSPAYDMIAAQLVVEGVSEELALTLNGKKKKITRKDFEAAMARFEIDQKAFDNIFLRFKKAIPKWHAFVENSFLTDEMKGAYQVMIGKKAKHIRL